MKRLFFFSLILLTTIASGQTVFNEYVDDIVNSQYSTSVISENTDSCIILVNDVLNHYDLDILEERSDSFNPFTYQAKSVLSKLKEDSNILNNLQMQSSGYSSAILPFEVEGKNCSLKVIIKYTNSDGYAVPFDEEYWKDTKVNDIENGYQSGGIKRLWENEYPGNGVMKSNILVFRYDYMFNPTSNVEPWISSGEYYSSGDVVSYNGYIYKCKYNHISQINIYPGGQGIWHWTNVTHIQPDLFVLYFNIIYGETF